MVAKKKSSKKSSKKSGGKGSGGWLFIDIRPVSNVLKHTDGILLSYSTGKDSLVCLDILKRYFKKIICFYMYLIPDLEHINIHLEQIEKEYKVKILQYPHFVNSFYTYNSVFKIHSDQQIPKVDVSEFYNKIRFDTGLQWIAMGIRQSDSIVRRAMIKSLPELGVDSKRKVFYPVYNFNKAKILEYTSHLNVSPVVYNDKSVSNGLSLSRDSVIWLKKNYPNDLKKMLEYYPLADAWLYKPE